ncbi:MAG: DNA-directed RNA polymerase subunit L [Nanoarchaeota archaeon]|nr:DNA-directed RNA polymerase subunit L [Nanoarchaeota archaeon]MBU4300265.1 DNA-directed RNA polymerase subunit L [Nanoarchaeota archaeon]MBU4452521.1 DNA-directed RNA polymerase subunit L [Nanoarchaeota archaeon]MCG2723226.1 DNA-directed RNA polymerase subunit L [archaeon]
MKINVLEEKKDSLVVEIEGERHTIPNLIRESLWEDNSVTLAAYEKKHPSLGSPKIIVKAKDPRNALVSAIKRCESETKDFMDEFEKAVK